MRYLRQGQRVRGTSPPPPEPASLFKRAVLGVLTALPVILLIVACLELRAPTSGLARQVDSDSGAEVRLLQVTLGRRHGFVYQPRASSLRDLLAGCGLSLGDGALRQQLSTDRTAVVLWLRTSGPGGPWLVPAQGQGVEVEDDHGRLYRNRAGSSPLRTGQRSWGARARLNWIGLENFDHRTRRLTFRFPLMEDTGQTQPPPRFAFSVDLPHPLPLPRAPSLVRAFPAEQTQAGLTGTLWSVDRLSGLSAASQPNPLLQVPLRSVLRAEFSLGWGDLAPDEWEVRLVEALTNGGEYLDPILTTNRAHYLTNYRSVQDLDWVKLTFQGRVVNSVQHTFALDPVDVPRPRQSVHLDKEPEKGPDGLQVQLRELRCLDSGSLVVAVRIHRRPGRPVELLESQGHNETDQPVLVQGIRREETRKDRSVDLETWELTYQMPPRTQRVWLQLELLSRREKGAEFTFYAPLR